MKKIFIPLYSLLLLVLIFFMFYLFNAPKKINPAVINIEPITAPVIRSSSPRLGDENAPVSIVEYADFNCPHCADTFQILKALQTKYPERVVLYWKDLPNAVEPASLSAHLAARCAQAQKQFWPFAESLFANPAHRFTAQYLDLAKNFNLQTVKFEECLSQNLFEPIISQDLREAAALGLTETPTIYINDKPYTGNLSLESLEASIANLP